MYTTNTHNKCTHVHTHAHNKMHMHTDETDQPIRKKAESWELRDCWTGNNSVIWCDLSEVISISRRPCPQTRSLDYIVRLWWYTYQNDIQLHYVYTWMAVGRTIPPGALKTLGMIDRPLTMLVHTKTDNHITILFVLFNTYNSW